MTDADNTKALLALCDKDSMIEYVARAIAQNGFGRSWVDFQESDIGDTDQNDLKEYAQAAIEAIEVRAPLSEQAILASCNAALDECAELTDADIKLIAAWAKQRLLSSASRPTEGEIAEIRKRHEEYEAVIAKGKAPRVDSVLESHRDRATLLRLLESRTAGAEIVAQHYTATGLVTEADIKAFNAAAESSKPLDLAALDRSLQPSPPRADTGVTRDKFWLRGEISRHVESIRAAEVGGDYSSKSVGEVVDAILALLKEQVVS